ncbi:MAG: hypothetical protein LBS21_12485, partial [Clostridiales bacterium]|nr:hypothetical protein [Clostridiales bacterium]
NTPGFALTLPPAKNTLSSAFTTAACKEHAEFCVHLCFLQRTCRRGFGVNYIAQHDCATRRGNDFRRRNT